MLEVVGSQTYRLLSSSASRTTASEASERLLNLPLLLLLLLLPVVLRLLPLALPLLQLLLPLSVLLKPLLVLLLLLTISLLPRPVLLSMPWLMSLLLLLPLSFGL